MIGLAVVVVVIAGFFLMRGQSTAPTTTETEPQEVMEKKDSSTGSEQGAMSKNSVEIKDFAFNPNSLTVKVGDTVTWTNKDVPGHSATADDNSFDTGVLGTNESGAATFDKAGTYTYHCTPHSYMKATVVVE